MGIGKINLHTLGLWENNKSNNKSTKNVTCLKFLAFQMAISQKNVETHP